MGTLVPALLATDGSLVAFKGFHDPENAFNGWASAYFDRDVTRAIVTHIRKENLHLQPGFRTFFRWEGDVLLMTEEQYDVADYPIVPDENGLYQVASGWTWQALPLPLDADAQTIRAYLKEHV